MLKFCIKVIQLGTLTFRRALAIMNFVTIFIKCGNSDQNYGINFHFKGTSCVDDDADVVGFCFAAFVFKLHKLFIKFAPHFKEFHRRPPVEIVLPSHKLLIHRVLHRTWVHRHCLNQPTACGMSTSVSCIERRASRTSSKLPTNRPTNAHPRRQSTNKFVGFYGPG